MWIPHCKPGLNFPKLKTRTPRFAAHSPHKHQSWLQFCPRHQYSAPQASSCIWSAGSRQEREWGESYTGKERRGGTWKAWTLATRVGSGVRKSMQPAKIEWWGVGAVICLQRGADCLHMVQLMPLHPKTPSSLAALKSWLVLPFWYWLTQANLERGR